MAAGALWVAATVVHAAKPRGCVGQECAYRAMRQSGPIDAALTLLSLVLLAAGVSGMVVLAKGTAGFGRAGQAGAALSATGTIVLVVASLVQAALFDDDLPLMPYLVIPGALALITGIVLLALGILRSGILPRWSAAALIVGALAMIGFNEQTGAVLLAIPLGLAWCFVGCVLCSGEADSPRPAKQ
jgi:hypothetical protein